MIERMEDRSLTGSLGLESFVLSGPAIIPLVEAMGVDVPGITTTDTRSSTPTGLRFLSSNFDARSITAGRGFRSDVGSSLLDSHFRDPALAINLSASHASDAGSTPSQSDRPNTHSVVSVREDLHGLSDKLIDSRLPSALADLWMSGRFSLEQLAARQQSSVIRGPSAGSAGESGSSHATGSAAPAVPDLGLAASVLGTPLMNSDSFATNSGFAGGVARQAPRSAATEPPPCPPEIRPIANPDMYGTPVDTPLHISPPGVLGNDTYGCSISGSPSASLAEGYAGPLTTQHGTLSLNANGEFDYTPDAGYVGTDGFTYLTTAGGRTSDPATVTINVGTGGGGGGGNQPPDAVDDTAAMPTGATSVTVGVLGNDTDPNGDSLTVTGVSQPSLGSATFTSSSVTYSTASGNGNGIWSASAVFGYTISDGQGGTDSATVTITLGTPPAGSVGNDGPYSTNEDTTLTVAAPGVLGNDSNVILMTNSTLSTKFAAVGIQNDGAFTYDPRYSPILQALKAGETTDDTFTYQAMDAGSNTLTGTVTVTVTGINDPPIALNDQYFLDEVGPGDSYTIDAPGVLLNDSDPEGDPLTASLTSGPAHAEAFTLNSNGSFTYKPAASDPNTTREVGGVIFLGRDVPVDDGSVLPSSGGGFEGITDSFTYSIADSTGATASARVDLVQIVKRDWSVRLLPTDPTDAQVRMDGEYGYRLKVRQIYGAKSPGATAKPESQYLQKNVRTARYLFVDGLANAKLQSATNEVWADKSDFIGGEKTPLPIDDTLESRPDDTVADVGFMVEVWQKTAGFSLSQLIRTDKSNPFLANPEQQAALEQINTELGTLQTSTSYLFVNRQIVLNLHAQGKITQENYDDIVAVLQNQGIDFNTMPNRLERFSFSGPGVQKTWEFTGP
jgi:VCBS repeat-containing protein